MKARWKIVMFVAGLAALAIALGGCHLWYQDMLGYMEHWTGTVQVSGLEWSAAPESQKDSGGRVTIPTNASVTATAAIVNPDGYSLDGGFGSDGDTLRSVRIAGASGDAVLGLASVTESTTTSITLGIRPVSSVTTPASRGLEHTDFTVTFIPTRTENGLASPTPRTLELRYNTPPRMPLEVVYDDAAKTLGWLGKDNIDGWKMVQNADPSLNGHIYWAWPKGITDPKDPDCVSEFHVYVNDVYKETVKANEVASGIDSYRSPVLADYYVYRVAASSGTRIEIYAVDGEGVKSRAAGSGIAPHKITLKAGEGFFASSGTASVELYKAGGSSVAGGDLETPYRVGYYLSGWTRDGSPVTFPLSVNAEMDLTAQWTPNPPVSTGTGAGTGSSSGTGGAGGSGTGGGVGGGTSVTTYTVTYDGNGATAGTAPQVQTRLAGKTLTLATNSGNLTRSGYTFTGWNTQANGGGTSYAEGAAYTKDESVTLYAKWTAWGTVATVTFSPDSGVADAAHPLTVTLSSATPGAEIRYTTDGSDPAATTARTGSSPVTVTVTGTTTIKAVATASNMHTSSETQASYSLKEYTVSLDNQGGSGTSQIAGVCHGASRAGTSVSVPTKTGYTFGGYWTQQNGQGTPCYNASGSGVGQWDMTTPVTTLYAKWTANTYTVKFNGNGGSSSTLSDQLFTYDVAKNLTANQFTRTDYTFTGWNTQADGNGTSYTGGQSVSNLTADPNGTVTLYAQWKRKLTGDVATIVAEIGKMTSPAELEVTVTGAMTSNDQITNEIRKALLELKTNAPGTRVKLDLSGVTGLTNLPGYSFNPANSNANACTNLVEVKLPNTVTSIGFCAFDCCGSLTYVDLGSGVTSIEAQAFDWTGSLTTIRVSASKPPTFSSGTNGSNDTFTKSAITTIEVPKAYLSAYQSSEWANITTKAGKVTIVGY